MFRRGLLTMGLTVALGVFGVAAHAQTPGRLTGGMKYEIPAWFTHSFLDIAADAAEAAEADRHAMLFMHSEE